MSPISFKDKEKEFPIKQEVIIEPEKILDINMCWLNLRIGAVDQNQDLIKRISNICMVVIYRVRQFQIIRWWGITNSKSVSHRALTAQVTRREET
jgi:hypothetical protein